MKKLMTMLVCVAFLISTSAQKSKEEAPAAAKSAFASEFPTAQKVKWSVEKPGEFEVEFTESSALYDVSGKLLETETEIREGALPQAAKATIAKDFAGFKLDEIEKATDAKGVASYEIEAAKGKEKLKLSFDANGKLLSKEPLKKEGGKN